MGRPCRRVHLRVGPDRLRGHDLYRHRPSGHHDGPRRCDERLEHGVGRHLVILRRDLDIHRRRSDGLHRPGADGHYERRQRHLLDVEHRLGRHLPVLHPDLGRHRVRSRGVRPSGRGQHRPRSQLPAGAARADHGVLLRDR
ncbi:hypothetical protein ACFPRL_30470 [Pseudoclavibacter helvolus]